MNKRLIAVLIIIALSGCEPNRYAPVEGDDNSDARWSAWRACEREAVHEVGACGSGKDSGFSGCGFGLSGEQVVGAAAFGVVGGAIGGAIFGGGLAASQADHTQKESPTRTYTDKCMEDKGYVLK